MVCVFSTQNVKTNESIINENNNYTIINDHKRYNFLNFFLNRKFLCKTFFLQKVDVKIIYQFYFLTLKIILMCIEVRNIILYQSFIENIFFLNFYTQFIFSKKKGAI